LLAYIIIKIIIKNLLMPREISLINTSPTFFENDDSVKNEDLGCVDRKKKRRTKPERKITGLLSAKPAGKNIVI